MCLIFFTKHPGRWIDRVVEGMEKAALDTKTNSFKIEIEKGGSSREEHLQA